MTVDKISSKCDLPSHFINIDGVKLHYYEIGEGDPILFLHGIPTSSYIWRNVIPHLSSLGRCIALDLIGFGQSEQPGIDYCLDDHLHYLYAFIEKLNLKHVVIVMHGFGSVLGFHYAMNHEANCKGLVFYEAFLRSLAPDVISLPLQEQLNAIQDIEGISDLANSGVAFIDKMIPQSVMRDLSADEMQHYRSPFTTSGTTRQINEYIKCFNDPLTRKHINDIIVNYSTWLCSSTLPKLMLYTIPGFITTIATIMWAKDNLPALEIIDIGEELHLGQESYPVMMGESISAWLQSLEPSLPRQGGNL